MALLVTELIFSLVLLELNVTVSLFSRLPLASFAVAVAVEVDVPFARIDVGDSDSVTLETGPIVLVWVSVAVPLTVPSAAVTVAVPAVVELVIVAV